MLRNSLTHKHFRRLAALLAADLLMFAGTEVNHVPSFMVMVGFLLLAFNLYYLLYLLFGVPAVYGFPLRARRQLALYSTLVVGGLLALQSIGQLNRRDLLLLAPLLAIGYTYGSYSRASRDNLSV